MIPFALDFKGAENGGSVIQFVYLSIVLSSSLLLIFSLKNYQPVAKIPNQVKWLFYVWCLYLLSTLLTTLINGVPLGNYVRVVMPFFLCGISMLIPILLFSRGVDLSFLFPLTLFCVLLSVIWTPVYALLILGIPLSVMRYQILSPVLPVLFGYGLCLFVLKPGVSAKLFWVLGLSFILVALSMTRSGFVIYIFTVVVLYIFLPSNYRRVFKKKAVVFIGPLLALLLFLFPVVEFLRPGFINIWIERFVGGVNTLGFDVTTITRLSEYSGQMNQLFSGFKTTFFGVGLGSEYHWDSKYFYMLSQVILVDALEDHAPWVAGHSLWVYSLYSGGLLFGFLVPYCIIKSLLSFNKLVKDTILSYDRQSSVHIMFFCMLVVSIVGASFFANPLGVRLVGVVFGLGLVLPHLFRQQVSEHIANKRKLIWLY